MRLERESRDYLDPIGRLFDQYKKRWREEKNGRSGELMEELAQRIKIRVLPERFDYWEEIKKTPDGNLYRKLFLEA